MHAGDKRPLTFAVLPIIEEAYVPPTISRQVTYLPFLALYTAGHSIAPSTVIVL